MDGGGVWKGVDGFDGKQEQTRPPLPTSPWKTGQQSPVSHKRPQAAASVSQRPTTATCFGGRISLEQGSSHDGTRGGMLLNRQGPMPLKNDTGRSPVARGDLRSCDSQGGRGGQDGAVPGPAVGA